MTSVRSTLLALSLSTALLGFGCGDADDATLKGDAPASETTAAGATMKAPADTKKAAVATAAAETTAPAAAPAAAKGKASARMKGTWGIKLPAAELEKLAAARKTLETSPDDPQAKMLTQMMDAMLGAMTLDVGDASMTMGSGEKSQTIPFTVKEDGDSKCVLSTKEQSGEEAIITVVFEPDGSMTWTKAGETNPLMWAKK